MYATVLCRGQYRATQLYGQTQSLIALLHSLRPCFSIALIFNRMLKSPWCSWKCLAPHCSLYGERHNLAPCMFIFFPWTLYETVWYTTLHMLGDKFGCLGAKRFLFCWGTFNMHTSVIKSSSVGLTHVLTCFANLEAHQWAGPVGVQRLLASEDLAQLYKASPHLSAPVQPSTGPSGSGPKWGLYILKRARLHRHSSFLTSECFHFTTQIHF